MMTCRINSSSICAVIWIFIMVLYLLWANRNKSQLLLERKNNDVAGLGQNLDKLKIDKLPSAKDEAAVLKQLYGNSRQMKTENDISVRQEFQFAGTSNGLHPDVNLVPSLPNPALKLPHKECVPLPESPKPGVQICIHKTDEDKEVSGSLKRNKLWEWYLIYQMTEVLKNDPSMMLFDVGCHIGVYTLWAAAMGRDVVAVEMLPLNVQMVQTALQLSGLDKFVTLINNAVYKEHKQLAIRFLEDSLGYTRLNVTKHIEKKVSEKTMTVQAVCIDDLIPLMRGRNVYMKMDIENSEHTALMGAEQFFEKVNVKIVQMEWHRRVPEESIPILDFMRRHEYVASLKPSPYEPIDLVTESRKRDVFFLKKSEYNIK